MDLSPLTLSTWLKGILLTVSAGSWMTAVAISLVRRQPYRQMRLLHSLMPYPLFFAALSICLPTFNRTDGPFDWEYVAGLECGLLSIPVGAVMLGLDARRIHRIHSKRGFEVHMVPKSVERR